MNKKILVTGGAGFVGSELTRQLCERGDSVTVVDNLVNGRREHLAGLPEDQVRLDVADIRESQRMIDLMQGVDIVYHLACLCLRHSLHAPEENHEVNATGTLRLLHAAKKAGVKRFVFTSTAEVYGTPRWAPVSEEHPNSPTNVYGAAKLAAEAYTLAFHQTYNYPATVVRLFNVYGPRCHHEGDCGEVIPKFLLRSMAGRSMVIFGDGSQTRDFNYVGDTARGILLAGLAEQAVGQIINLGTGRPTSINELAETVAEVAGQQDVEIVHDRSRPGDVLGLFYADNCKAKQLLGYEPEVSLREGLVKLRDWYLRRENTPEELLEQEILHNWEVEELKPACKTESFIPVARPWLDEKEVEAARRPIMSGWVTMGPEVRAFENDFARYVGAEHACAISSCTTGLHLALLAAGVQPGDEVITVSHSFIATANSIRYCGATPVFADIDPVTFNIDPALIEPAITERTKAILCVHQMGMPCDMKAIMEIARRHSLAVVEDTACASGSEILWDGQWEKIGKPHGDASSFSFHPRKVVTTGDGGMITTSNPEWDERFRLWRHHGMSIQTTKRHKSREVIFETYPELAYNYRMTDIQAAIGQEQLKRLPEMIARRRYLAGRYQQLLAEIPGVIAPEEPAWARSNWQSYCVRLPEELDQKQVMQAMLDRDVATRRGIMCAHREPAYADFPLRWPLPESEYAQDHSIILPLYHQMTEADQDRVVEVLEIACRKS